MANPQQEPKYTKVSDVKINIGGQAQFFSHLKMKVKIAKMPCNGFFFLTDNGICFCTL